METRFAALRARAARRPGVARVASAPCRHCRLHVADTGGAAQVVLFQAPRKGAPSASASGSRVFNLKVAP